MGFFKNLPINIRTKEVATFEQFSRAVESNLGQTLEASTGSLTLKSVLDSLSLLYSPEAEATGPDVVGLPTVVDIGNFYPITAVSNFAILNDVFIKLRHSHYDSEVFKEETLIQGAAKGMAEASGDKHTAYFPPVESKNFQDSLNGEFAGIGAYIDMPKPGELHIVSPISGTPSEKAGLK